MSEQTGPLDPESLTLPTFEARRNLRQEIAHALRAALITGEMQPGLLYSAPVLAEHFGVSATPVREAMLDLANEGLVEAVRNKGFRVTELSNRELDEITDLRALIEVPTVGAIAARLTDGMRSKILALRPVAEEIQRQAAAANFIAYVEADRRFHLGLLGLAGNEQLVQLVGDLRARSRLYGLAEVAKKDELVRSSEEHFDILESILAEDEEKAISVMRRHIGRVRGTWAAPVVSSDETQM